MIHAANVEQLQQQSAYSVLLCGGSFQAPNTTAMEYLQGNTVQCVPKQGPDSSEQALLRDVRAKWPAINTTQMYNFPLALGPL